VLKCHSVLVSVWVSFACHFTACSGLQPFCCFWTQTCWSYRKLQCEAVSSSSCCCDHLPFDDVGSG